MKVSLIVCTRNRAERLPRFLASIAALESPAGGWELILVDNGSTDSTLTTLEQFARQAAFPVRVVQASLPGLARARNVGLAHARGEIIAFTDDDCYPRQDYLRAIVTVFEESRQSDNSGVQARGLGFVGGRIVLHNPDDARVCLKDVATPLDLPARRFLHARHIHGANMAVLREVVAAIGGFDPLLGAGRACAACEDTDYLARAAWAGWSGRYDPRIVVAHDHGRKPGPAATRQLESYDYGRGAYYAKFLLMRDARRAYARNWWETTMRRPDRFARLRRELIGAARYLVVRLVRYEPIPSLRLPEAAGAR